jgi:hypothetical protein
VNDTCDPVTHKTMANNPMHSMHCCVAPTGRHVASQCVVISIQGLTCVTLVAETHKGTVCRSLMLCHPEPAAILQPCK